MNIFKYEHIIDICDEIYVMKDGRTILKKNFRDIEKYGYAGNTAVNKKHSTFDR